MLPSHNARFIGQGITGAEGTSATEASLAYGTQIVAGVTPGKGGTEHLGLPIFDTIKEALVEFEAIDGVVQFVPPLMVKKATIEAIEAGIKLILIVAEKVPTADTAYIYQLAQQNGVTLIGPSSVGLISPKHQIKLGAIGGRSPERVYPQGHIGIISKSGGMTSEIGLHLKNNDLGVSWAVGIGGERLIGTDFVDFLKMLEQDPETQASVIFGELGGTYEEKVAEAVQKGQITKPVIAFIGGDFTQNLPNNVQFGHAGAIIEGTRGLPESKRQILGQAGVKVADNFDDIATLIKESI